MSRTVANLLMLLTAFIWGTTFVAQKLGMDNVGPLTYTGLRFLMGAVFISPLAWREYRLLQSKNIELNKTDLARWIGLGLLLLGGALFQQIGMLTTTVTNAGFLTVLYVPLVPLLAWIIQRHKPHISVFPATVCTVFGTFLLGGGRLDSFVVGDFWVLSSTLFWGFHVFWVGVVAGQKGAPILVAFWQFVTCGILAMLIACFQEPITTEGIRLGLPAILYGGILSVGIAFTLQVVAQRHSRASDAAILFSSETLFAALAGALYLDERLSLLQLSGCVLIFMSILAVQLMPIWKQPDITH